MIHVKIAENLGMIPVIDFYNFRTYYNEDHLINDCNNSWEYYL